MRPGTSLFFILNEKTAEILGIATVGRMVIEEKIEEMIEEMIEKKKPQVAAYARVSTEEEEQQSSYDAQISYYTECIKSNPDWEFVKVYSDEGISGTSFKNRPGFNMMLGDAIDGKIDRLKRFVAAIEKADIYVASYNEEPFRKTVERILVRKDGKLVYVFIDGNEIVE